DPPQNADGGTGLAIGAHRGINGRPVVVGEALPLSLGHFMVKKLVGVGAPDHASTSAPQPSQV
uniref:hypothetical protein n=1 Tax=Candidatus Entotheonella palauensis TaxID=93172 RepID=UPI001C4DF871